MKKQGKPDSKGLPGKGPWGAHTCGVYRDQAELADIAVPFLKAGLAAGEYCCYVTSAPAADETIVESLRATMPEANRFIKDGQLEIKTHDEWYLTSGAFKPQETRFQIQKRLERVLHEGYPAMRIVQEMAGFNKRELKKVSDFEAALEMITHGVKIRALCLYRFDDCDATGLIDILRNHDQAFINRDGSWQDLKNSQQEGLSEMLEESEERYRALFGSVPGGVFVIDAASMKIVLANQALADMFGNDTPVEDVVRQLKRSERWVVGELEAFLRENGLTSPYPWVDDATFARVAEAAEHLVGSRIKSIRQRAGEDLTETQIRLCLACLHDR